MAAPTRTGVITQSNNGATTLVVDISALANGSWMLLEVQSGASAVTITTPSGWTALLSNVTMGSRGISLYGKIKAPGETSVSLVKSGSNNLAILLAHGTGGDVVANWILGTGKLRATSPAETVTTTAKSITTMVADSLALAASYEVTTAAEGSAPVTSGTGWAAWGYRADGAADGGATVPEQLRIAYKVMTSAGATGDETDTYANTQASNGYGIQVAIPPAAAPQVGPAGYRVSGGTVQMGNAFYFDGTTKRLLDPADLQTHFRETRVSDIFRDDKLWFGLHRGGSYNHPEMTLYGFQGCADMGARVMEISVHYSSEGTPWCFHDSTVDRTASAGETGTIVSKNDATLAAISNKGGTAAGNTGQPARPTAKLVDVLNAWSETHGLIIEDKTYIHTTALLNLLDTYDTVDRPSTERFVIKMDATTGSDTVRAAAAGRGYQTWAYIFDANMGSPFTTALTRAYDMIGLDFNSSDETLEAAIVSCISEGISPTGHIIASQAQRDRLLDLGMTGLMLSNKFILPNYLAL